MDSLKIVQEFFADNDLSSIAGIARQMPHDQMIVLAEQIEALAYDVPYFGHLRTPADSARLTPYLHDVLTSDWSSGQMARSTQALKHLLLYCETIAAPDPLGGWARRILDANETMVAEAHEGQQLARILLGLRDLSVLGDTDAITVFPAFQNLGVDTGGRMTHLGDEADTSSGVHFTPEMHLYEDSNQYIEGLPAEDDDIDAAWLDNYFRRSGERNKFERWRDDATFLTGVGRTLINEFSFHDSTDLELVDTWWENTFLAGLIVDHCARKMGWQLAMKELDPMNPRDWGQIVYEFANRDGERSNEREVVNLGRDELAAAIGSTAYPGWAYEQDAVRFASFIDLSSAIPVCSTSVTASLVRRLTSTQTPSYRREESILGPPGVKYAIPSLGNVSMNDIVKMRSNEEVFAEVRNALLNLQAECLARGGTDIGKYNELISEAANDIVGPVHQRLARSLKRSKVKSLAAGGLVRVGLKGFSSLLGSPSTLGLDRIAGGFVSKRFSRKQRVDDRQTACAILWELLE